MIADSKPISGLSITELQSLIADLKDRQSNLEKQNGYLQTSLQSRTILFEHLPRPYIILDSIGNIIHINQAAVELLRCMPKELSQKPLKNIIHHAEISHFEAYLSDLLGGLTHQEPIVLNLTIENDQTISVKCRGCIGKTHENRPITYLLIHKNEDISPNSDSLADVIAELEYQVIKKSDDLEESNKNLSRVVDELNYARRQLLEREAKLNSILNASIEGIIVIDTAGIVVSVNAAVEKIFGYSAEELIGSSVKKLMPMAMRKKQEYYLEKYLKIFVPKAIGQIREVEGLRKDGTLVPLDMTLAEFPIDGVHYYSGIVRDVTARKQQEQQEKEHLEKLAHVTRLGLMGEMASGIAHEVNQPLSAVVNYTQVCLNFINSDTPDLVKITEILKKANRQALKAGQIIHSMREFVKPRKIHRSTVDINELIYDAISIFDADFKQHLIAMRFELTKTLPCVFIDRVQIEQVILNLIRNSIDALKELPQFTQRQLSIETSLNEFDYIVVRVKDNGPGLTPEQREKILTPFFTTKSSGMGMGLSISRSLIEAHHGTLHFNSKEDKGTTFYFTLPTESTHNGRNQT